MMAKNIQSKPIISVSPAQICGTSTNRHTPQFQADFICDTYGRMATLGGLKVISLSLRATFDRPMRRLGSVHLRAQLAALGRQIPAEVHSLIRLDAGHAASSIEMTAINL